MTKLASKLIKEKINSEEINCKVATKTGIIKIKTKSSFSFSQVSLLIFLIYYIESALQLLSDYITERNKIAYISLGNSVHLLDLSIKVW